MIRIYGREDQLPSRRTAISNAIHACMVEVLGLPEGKRAQRFIRLSPEDFIAPADRSEAYTVIEMSLIAGRSVETKKALIYALFARLQAEAGLAPIDVEITISEQPAHCWGFRGMTGDDAVLDYAIQV